MKLTTRVPLRLTLLSMLAIAVALTVPFWSALAGNANPRVLPPNSNAFGKTYGEWSAAWWQYVSSVPFATNPLFDATGANCALGQSGPVFFLMGVPGNGAVTRNDCTVPAGKALFFPMANGVDIHVPGDGLDTPQAIWDDLEVTFGFSVFTAHASIDGSNVANLNGSPSAYRACAGPVAGCASTFSVTLPDNNIFGIPAGTYGPAVDDGTYLMVAPLPPGEHTISFGGTGFFGGPFSQDVTYHLTVSAT